MASAVKVYKHFQTPQSAGTYHRLICLTGEKKGLAYFIEKGERVVMGRSEESDIQIFDLKSSREHAEIIQVGEEFIVSDLGSQNGIIVNDLKVKQHVLSDGDKLIIGKTVYKFSRVTVEDHNRESEEVLNTDIKKEDDEAAQNDKKLSRILLGIVILASIVWGLDGTKDSEELKTTTRIKQKEDSLSDNSFGLAIQKKAEENQIAKKKLERYFHRGLREFREGNYFRAYVEFENARQWNPKDATANFYLRKTKEKQNEIIASYFSKGSRDLDALNFKAAITSYCTIIRLLVHHLPDDTRIKQARDNLRLIEKKTGQEDKSIVCVKK